MWFRMQLMGNDRRRVLRIEIEWPFCNHWYLLYAVREREVIKIGSSFIQDWPCPLSNGKCLFGPCYWRYLNRNLQAVAATINWLGFNAIICCWCINVRWILQIIVMNWRNIQFDWIKWAKGPPYIWFKCPQIFITKSSICLPSTHWIYSLGIETIWITKWISANSKQL